MKTYNIPKFIVTILLPLVLLGQGENWIYFYDGPGYSYDDANSIVYGADGNIYAAGTTGDNNGNAFTVISLTNTGDTNWIYLSNVGSEAYSIVDGADGNIYAAGITYGESDIMVISLTPAGDTNWVYQYDGPGNSMDITTAIVFGADNNIYVAGYSIGSGTSTDFVVISLTSAGDTNWVYRYNGPGNGPDNASSLVFGTDSNIYAAGSSFGGATEADFTVISLTTAGDTNWVHRFIGSGGNGYDAANSITYGIDGNIYATGRSIASTGIENFTVISLTPAGDTNWVYRYAGPENSGAWGSSIVFGGDSNIYAAGRSYDYETLYDFTVISLTTHGDTNWVYRYDNDLMDPFYYHNAPSIVYGADGNIYAAGNTYNGSNKDFTVISLTNTGDTRWVYQYDGSGNDDDYASSIVFGADNNIYAAGYCNNSGTFADFTVISLPSDLGVKEGNNIVLKNTYDASIFSGPLRLPKDKACKVFDITGRVVMPDRLKPGIYFIQIDGKIVNKIIKVK